MFFSAYEMRVLRLFMVCLAAAAFGIGYAVADITATPRTVTTVTTRTTDARTCAVHPTGQVECR